MENSDSARNICGIVMPISGMSGYSASHWADVLSILKESAADANYDARLVSDSVSADVIHSNIIKNLYSDRIVIIDVSAQNPNVMFEMGVRIAFDKPAIVIKDNETTYPFDIGPLKYIEYPKNLHYQSINIFKTNIKEKMLEIDKLIEEGGSYSPFLDSFGPIESVKMKKEEVGYEQYSLNRMIEMSDKIDNLFALIQKYGQEKTNSAKRFFAGASVKTMQARIDSPIEYIDTIQSAIDKLQEYSDCTLTCEREINENRVNFLLEFRGRNLDDAVLAMRAIKSIDPVHIYIKTNSGQNKN